MKWEEVSWKELDRKNHPRRLYLFIKREGKKSTWGKEIIVEDLDKH